MDLVEAVGREFGRNPSKVNNELYRSPGWRLGWRLGWWLGLRLVWFASLPIGATGCAQKGVENEKRVKNGKSVGLVPIRGIRLRRAVMGTLLIAEWPLCIAEIVEQLEANGVTTMPHLTRTPNRVVADLLAHQVRAGRAQKVGRATFILLPDSVSVSTRRRWRRWNEGRGDAWNGLIR